MPAHEYLLQVSSVTAQTVVQKVTTLVGRMEFASQPSQRRKKVVNSVTGEAVNEYEDAEKSLYLRTYICNRARGKDFDKPPCFELRQNRPHVRE